MLKRKMTDRLLAWKASHGRECLLVNGARQVGKSFIIERFGEASYRNFIKLDFIEHPEYAGIFSLVKSSDESVNIKRRGENLFAASSLTA